MEFRGGDFVGGGFPVSFLCLCGRGRPQTRRGYRFHFLFVPSSDLRGRSPRLVPRSAHGFAGLSSPGFIAGMARRVPPRPSNKEQVKFCYSAVSSPEFRARIFSIAVSAALRT